MRWRPAVPGRLCRTVQLSDTGLIPGSGVGSHRTAVDRETVGVPVIAVGVPTVIDGAALGSDTEEVPQGLYVTPRDIDRQVVGWGGCWATASRWRCSRG